MILDKQHKQDKNKIVLVYDMLKELGGNDKCGWGKDERRD